MQDNKLTTRILLKAWWAMQWRAILATIVGSFVMVAIFTFFATIFGISKELIVLGANMIYTFIAIFASIYFFGFALKKDYGSFRFKIEEKSFVAKSPESSQIMQSNKE